MKKLRFMLSGGLSLGSQLATELNQINFRPENEGRTSLQNAGNPIQDHNRHTEPDKPRLTLTK